MKEKEPLPSEVKDSVLAIARLRLTCRHTDGSFRAASAKREINEIIEQFPQLSTQRAIAFFPQDGHLEIAKKPLTTHAELWRKRGQDCKERRLRLPTTMVSGEFFEINGEKFLKFDASVMQSAEVDLSKLAETGYTILLPYFELYSPAGNTG